MTWTDVSLDGVIRIIIIIIIIIIIYSYIALFLMGSNSAVH